MKTSEIKYSRFELHLTKEDKLFFEKVSQIAGYKTLSSFVLSAVKEFATKIINEKEQILASERDKEIFCKAFFSNIEPNTNLKEASKKYIDIQSAK